MKIKSYVIVFASLFTLAVTSQVFAQSDRVFVSTAGVDSATCGGATSPCRNFNVAIPKTNAGGEVLALDSGVYDSFNVAIAISITLTAAPGVHAELPGITINTGNSSTASVTL